eukprot:6589700-Prymnesium_polylepis.1
MHFGHPGQALLKRAPTAVLELLLRCCAALAHLPFEPIRPTSSRASRRRRALCVVAFCGRELVVLQRWNGL